MASVACLSPLSTGENTADQSLQHKENPRISTYEFSHKPPELQKKNDTLPSFDVESRAQSVFWHNKAKKRQASVKDVCRAIQKNGGAEVSPLNLQHERENRKNMPFDLDLCAS